MKPCLIAAVIVVASPCQAVENFDVSNTQIHYLGKNTRTVPLELSRWCIDNGKEGVKQRDWEHQANGRMTWSCTLDTEGDGTEGSATVVTFTYHFVRTSSKAIKLERVTTSDGKILPPDNVLHGVIPLGR